ncbi:MAG: glycosyltransferase family 39 protein [Microthrixaceae bacterium]|nr:glycosyltransferase family 39 protein [Microthrixaceae bacterium]
MSQDELCAESALRGNNQHTVRGRTRGGDRPRLAVAGIAVALRAVAAVAFTSTPVGLHDPLLYQRFAQGIAKGQGYVSFNGELTSYYPPGYPLFLGAVQWLCDLLSIPGSLPIVAALVQALLGGVTAWAIVGVGDRLAPAEDGVPLRRRVGVVAGLVVAVWPNLVLHSTVLLSESLFLAVFACFLLAIVRAVDSGKAAELLGAGVVLGLAMLVRPQVALVMAAVVVAALLVRRTPAQRALVVVLPLAGIVLALMPWTIRNATVFDRFVAVSTNGGDNLCVGFHPNATGHFEIPEYCDTGEFYIDGPDAEYRRNRETSLLAREWAAGNLGALPALSIRKLWYTYQHDHDALRAVESYEEDRFLPSPVRNLLRWGSDGFFVLVAAATVGGGAMLTRRWWSDRRGEPLVAFLLLATATSALVPVLFFGETRFKVPATPCFALLAAVCLVAVFQRDGEVSV